MRQKQTKDTHPPCHKINIFVLWLILFIPVNILAGKAVYSQVYSFTTRKMPLAKVINKVETQTGYRVLYNVDDLKGVDCSPFTVEDANVSQIIEKCLFSTSLDYDLDGNQIIIFKKEAVVQEEERLISGTVKDSSTKEALPGVNVVAQKGNSILNGTTTDEKGHFHLKLRPGANSFVVSMIGYKTRLVPLTTDLTYKILLEPSVQEIEDVVVTGIFNKAKESFTGAATFIGKTELRDFENRDILKTINNIDPSFNIVANDELGSDPNKLPEINIRGTSSVSTATTAANSQYTEDDFEDLKDNERVNLNTPLFILDGFEITLQRMMDLNQDEIESITILKDASATAIYGSQGANGVVVLTSIKPKTGKLKVTYRGGFNVEVPDLRSYDLLNASEKLELEQIAGLYESDDFNQQLLLKKVYNNKLKTIKEGTDTYWLSKPVQVGIGQSHSINLGGGDPAFRYGLNFQYRNTVGAMKGSERDNFNGSINITYLFKKLQFTNILSLGFNNSENSQYGAFSTYASLNPYWKLYDDEGEMIQQFGVGDPMMSTVYNPLYNASLGGYDKRRYTNINENFKIEWTIKDEIKLSGRLGYSKNSSISDRFTPPNHTDFIGKDDELSGKYVFTTTESSTISGQLTLNFAKVIDKHRFFLGINGNVRESQRVSYGVIVTGFAHDRMDFISMGSQYSGDTPYGSEGTSRSVGVTSNFNYTYDNTYYIDASYRLDGASSFGKDSRFAPFYSVGVGWNVYRTKFFKEHVPTVSNLRLRYSYGVTGSLQFSPYDAMTTYNYLIGDDRYNGHLGTTIKKIGNPDLQWQTTYQHNIGLDFGLWKNRISFNGNYYYKRTEDLITTVSLPLSNGYTNYTENMGDVLNQGVELNLSLNVMRQTATRPGWSLTGGISHNRNKLLSLSEAMKEINNINETYSDNQSPVYLYREGESMNALYVVPSIGIDPATGREMFVNADGDVTYDYPTFNKVPYGLMQPKINGRLSSNLSYKNVRLNVGFSFRLGASVYNSTLASKVETNDLTRNVDARVYDDRWRQPGDVVPYKGLDTDLVTYMSSRFVQEERTLSLSSLSIDYRVPQKLVKKFINMSRLNLSYSTNDLLYFSTIKKERGTGYPFASRHNISISMGF